MSDDRWERLLEHLRRARAKPTFDAEEREYRLAVAGELREVMQAAAEGGPWLESLVGLLHGTVGYRRFDLTQRIPARWLASNVPPESLTAFADAEAPPAQRFDTFARAVATRLEKLSQPLERWFNNDPDQHAVLALGSLFNFAAQPERLPVARPETLNMLEQALGREWTFRRPLTDLYERHLDFIGEVGERCTAAGIPVRDMLDVQSLVTIAGDDADFWMADPARDPRAAGAGTGAAGTPYLSVCAIYRNEAHYLREWLEFHRLAGVERFFLYDNDSEDDHMDVLAPYIAEGIVSVRPWPVFDGQIAAYDDCLRAHRFDSRWIAMIDLDEFLFSPGGRPVSEVLTAFERWPAVAVAWAQFGTNGHRTRPTGLVIENYVRRIPVESWKLNIKSIVDPVRVTHALNAHRFETAYLSTVDEHHQPVRLNLLHSPTYEHLRLNHYIFKSEEEYVRKAARWHELRDNRKTHVTPEMLDIIRDAEQRTGYEDKEILSYLPELRAALSARNVKAGEPSPAAGT